MGFGDMLNEYNFLALRKRNKSNWFCKLKGYIKTSDFYYINNLSLRRNNKKINLSLAYIAEYHIVKII